MKTINDLITEHSFDDLLNKTLNDLNTVYFNMIVQNLKFEGTVTSELIVVDNNENLIVINAEELTLALMLENNKPTMYRFVNLSDAWRSDVLNMYLNIPVFQNLTMIDRIVMAQEIYTVVETIGKITKRVHEAELQSIANKLLSDS